MISSFHREAEAAVLLPELIARQVAASPDAVAVVDSRRQLTYAELDSRANRLANFLRRDAALGREALVAVCVRRSVDQVVALLGAWKAGLAYVPLDPDHPRERLAWQLADTSSALVLTDRTAAATLAGCGLATVCLDSDAQDIATAPDCEPDGVLRSRSSTAYAIYTSGSTGRPKAVLIDHGGIANRIRWTVRQHGLSAADRVLQRTPLTFDAAGWEIFAPLSCGGTVVLAPVGADQDPVALLRAMTDHRITVLQTVPSVLRLLVDEPRWAGCDALRLVLSAGEPLHAELCQRLLARAQVEVWNTYGPTECSIDATAERFDPSQQSGPVSIGRPIDNMYVRVLDTAGTPVPVGMPGELYVGGWGLARGYLGRPSVTAERFVPDRFGDPGSRLYRTGDLVRWGRDGKLAYLGRVDDQVKVNGVRVEPAEVEAALLNHPGIRAAVVAGRADRSGAVRLVAYLQPADIDPERLRAFLGDLLPRPLIPTTFVGLDAFPMTPSGKVDRAALPAHVLDAGSGRPPFQPPRNDDERLVAREWSTLLGVDQVGVHDSFFQVGGSSLLITRLASVLGTAAGREIAVPDLFYATTVAAQARLVAAAPAALAPIPPVARDRPLPLSFGQRRQWFLDLMQPGSVEWLAPMLLDIPADIGPATVQQALDALVSRHETLRTRYELGADGEPVQVIEAPRPVALELADTSESDLGTLFGREFATGFDLGRSQQLRALLVRTSPRQQLLLVTMHHIACDGRSTVVLEHDLKELCAAFYTDREPALAQLPVRYADFAVWQRERLSTEVVRADLEFWQEALKAIGPLNLPFDRPRPAQWDAHGAVRSFHVPTPVGQRIIGFGQEHGATPFMTLLTVFGMLLSRYCGQGDIPVGVPVSGRVHPQVERTVGFFLNSLVLRCDLSGSPSFVDALCRVRDMTLSCFAHQRLPFERLVEDSRLERDSGRNPFYQVELDVHEEGWTGTKIDAAGLDAFQRAWTVAKSDLCLHLHRHVDGSMTGIVEYATALFDAETIDRFTRHYVGMLEAAAAAPEAPLSAVEFLTADEREELRTQPWPCTDVRSAGSPGCVLDPDGNLVPKGVPGEVHIAAALADGAAQAAAGADPARTVKDPFDRPGVVLHPTGERARRRVDGTLELLGPISHEIRNRDYWVDPRQIEAVLTRNEAVGDAAVVSSRRDEGGTGLRAYWAPALDRPAPLPDEAELARLCRAQLSPHQVPDEFVRLQRIPRTARGDVDVALALQYGGCADVRVVEQAPRNAAEQRIATVWAALLDADAEIAVRANFFSLGGNSIAAIQMISAVREEFGVEVPFRAFFENATIAGLAEEVTARICAELTELSDSDVLAELTPPREETAPVPAAIPSLATGSPSCAT